MLHIDALEQVRKQVIIRFDELGAATDEPICETILIREGFYCGRRFERDDITAIWFIGEDELKFHDREGSVVDVLKPNRPPMPDRRDAG